jgi:hypothetical protein
VGIFRWDTAGAGDTVYFSAGGSVDMGYRIAGVVQDGQFLGTGESWGMEAHGWPLDSVIGSRVGTPDASRCLQEADRQQH